MPTSPYFNSEGVPLPGTTTVISRFKESGGLLQWACKVGYEQGLAKQRMNLYAPRDREADVGTYIHALIEWHVNGESGPRPEPPEGLAKEHWQRGVNGYEMFLRWQARTRLHIVSWEKPLVSETYQFGGTPDALFEFENGVSVGDWKGTGKIYPDNLIQAAAYLILFRENHPELDVHGAHVVRFSKDYSDIDHKQVEDLTVETRQFLRFLDAYRDDKLISARVK